MRKSSVTSRSSLPSGASSCQTTSSGFCPPKLPRSLPCTPWLVPSRCLRKYSWPLPELPSRFERQTNRLRGKLAGLSGSSQDILSAAGLQHADGVVLRIGAGGRGVLHDLQRIGLQLRRARQPAHPLGAHVEVDQAARVFVRVGERRQDLLDLELLVAPLVGVRVEERRRVHLPRRAVPVERERERGPAGLRAQLLLADVVRPAAARLPDAAAHHQHVDDAAVVHVAVEPVVHRGADDHHRLAVRLVGVVGELAGDGDHLVGRHAGDLLLPGRRVGHVVVVATRRRCRRPGRGRRRSSRTSGRRRSRPASRRRRGRASSPARCAAGCRRPGRCCGRPRARCRRSTGTRPPRRRPSRRSATARASSPRPSRLPSPRGSTCRGRRPPSGPSDSRSSPAATPRRPSPRRTPRSSIPGCWPVPACRRNRRRAPSGRRRTGCRA